jgi:hypothetical protein
LFCGGERKEEGEAFAARVVGFGRDGVKKK